MENFKTDNFALDVFQFEKSDCFYFYNRHREKIIEFLVQHGRCILEKKVYCDYINSPMYFQGLTVTRNMEG